MRFGRTLQISVYPPWKGHYIDYAKLKKLLREDESAPTSPTTASGDQQPWTESDESNFVDELVNVQLEKVHKFHRETYDKLRDRTAKCEARLDTVAVADRGVADANGGEGEGEGEGILGGSNGNNGKKPVPSEEEKSKILNEVLSELDEITKETNELEKYSRINYTGFLKAAKKHDRKRGGAYRVRPLLQVRLAALPFNKEDYGPLLYRLSTMYNFVREHLSEADAKAKLPELQEGKEEYISHKFWVHPENVLEVKTMILRRLPVLVYNPLTSKVADGSQPELSTTSIYFDNPAFDLYSNKVENNAGSSLRLRWYGHVDNRPEIWIEKKTVQEDGTSHESRVATKDKYVQRFINNEYHMEKQIHKVEERAGAESSEALQLKASVGEIQDFIQEHNLQPVLRANYQRTAFQIPGDDRVRVSLDTDVAFIREDAIDERPCRDPETWHRTDIDNNKMSFPFSAVRKGEVSRFPFALLEIKLRSTPGKKSSEWIDDIMTSHLVKEAPRFSKFVHGVAQLFEDYVNTFPFWLSAVETDIRRDPHVAFEEEQAKKQKEAEDEFAVGSLLKSRPSASPLSRGAIVSPVGSPSVEGSVKRNDLASAQRKPSHLSTSVNAEPTQLNDVVEEPDEDETGIHTHRSGNESSTGGLKTLLPSFSTSKYARSKRAPKVHLPPGVSEPKAWIKDQGPVKVEAKVWLANQRTFIKWQHVSVLLASLSLGLYNAAGQHNNVARALAIVYTVVAIFTAVWGYGIYMWRTNLIQSRSGKDFDAITGPIVVCVGLVVALVLNFGFKYHAVMQERQNAQPQPLVVQNSYLTKFGNL